MNFYIPQYSLLFLCLAILPISEELDYLDEHAALTAAEEKQVKNAAALFLRDILQHPRPIFSRANELWPLIRTASDSVPQNNIVSVTKRHALFLWIHLKPTVSPVKCAKAVANIERLVADVTGQSNGNSDNEMLYGVGFGQEMYNKLGLNPVANYYYPYRTGYLLDLPSTGGDIFVHAKSNIRGDLYYLAEKIRQALPPGSLQNFADTYGFEYRNGRDLSGFIDGTENPAGNQRRYQVAVNKQTHGSFCVSGHVIHELGTILEGWVGRTMNDSQELRNKSPTSHVARMTSGASYHARKPFEIVRQSMPYGNIGEKVGLFFLAFAASPENFEYMLSRMTGPSASTSDDIMRISRCQSGTYWYFPSMGEMKKLQ